MSGDISERDWKVFREVHRHALERFSARILAEAQAEISRPESTSHERYLRLYRLFEERDHDIARAFNDLRRSTALMQLGILDVMGLVTPQELERFSPEVRESLALLARFRKA
ncbi:MAG: hypothetical protein JNN07_06965 [Verrucomicrobiales bacterium]|nr:hypothetical protein [Verrucomicrobiales bacterium]